MPTLPNFGRARGPALRAPRRASFGSLSAIALCLLLFAASGCGRSDPQQPSRQTRQHKTQHADFLPTIMNMARPERLGLDTSAEQVARMLNRWRDVQEAEPSETVRLSAAAERLVKEQLPPGTLEAIRRERFDERDAEHLRTARLMRQVVERLVRTEPDPARRAVALFDFVGRNVELVADGAIPPLTPFEVLLYGRGTAADRAWIFAELLRQLQIDAVILAPAEATATDGTATDGTATDGTATDGTATEGNAAGSLLVGALVGEDVLLFDPRLGAAVPPPDAAAENTETDAEQTDAEQTDAEQTDADETAPGELLPARPATLADLPADQSARWRPAVVGTAALWSPRMRLLQGGLRGDEIGAVVHQPLSTDEADSSILERVRTAGGSAWSADDVTLWPYPQQQLNRRASGDLLVYEKLHAPMRMPRQFFEQAPPEGQPGAERLAVLGEPTRALWKQRIDHLLGRPGIQGYQEVQTAARKIRKFRNLSLDVVQTHEDAADDAMFWIGVVQMDGLTDLAEKRYSLAADRFVYYIGQHTLRGRHTSQARLLLARALAEQGDMDAAVAALREVPESDPLYAAAQFRIRRWSSNPATGDESQPSEPMPATPPAEADAKPAVAEKAE